jgi:hypothetical protein
MSKKTQVPSWPPAHILACGRKFRKRVGLDLHGTVLDFDGPFGEFLAEIYTGASMNPNREVYHVAGDPTSKIGFIEFERTLNKFIHLTTGGYDSFPAIAGAIEQLKRIRAAGIEIEVMTYVPGASDMQYTDMLPHNTGAARLATKMLLKKLGFPIEESDIVFLPTHAKSWHMLDQGVKIPLIVEDRLATACDVVEKGLGAIVYPASYNQCSDIPGLLRVAPQAKPEDTWKVVADNIISFFDALEANGQIVGTGGK